MDPEDPGQEVCQGKENPTVSYLCAYGGWFAHFVFSVVFGWLGVLPLFPSFNLFT
jgi:hypothetical protein